MARSQRSFQALPTRRAKLGIDATRKWPEGGFARDWPDAIEMTPEIRDRVDKLLGEET